MTVRRWLASALIATSPLTGAAPLFAADPPKPNPTYSFSTLNGVSADVAKAKLELWLKSKNQFDAAKLDAIWSNASRSVVQRTLETIPLGLPEAVALLHTAKNADLLPPSEVPPILKDTKLDPFVRANLAASYAKELASKRVYEEALETMKAIQPELLIDPASYYFYKAVSEYSLIQREAAINSIDRLLYDVTNTPDRYKVVATLMFFDIQQWSKDDKDLGNIGRLMDNSGRRLDLARSGQKTQEIQKKIVFRLDEKIKELEQQQKKKKGSGSGQPGEGSGDQPGNGQGSNPMQDSNIATNSGPGQVDPKKLRQYEESWGKLPEAERKKIMTDVARDVPDKWKPIIEDYFRTLNKMHGYKP